MSTQNYIYSKAELYQRGERPSYPGEAREAAFPLGGIGTGNVSIGARGELRDWEIFNWPGKKNFLPFTFFALWAQKEGSDPVARILEREVTPHYNKSHGFLNGELAGLPRFRESRMSAGYPFVEVALCDDAVPLEVTMEAFTPLIPLNAEDSAIPAAVIRYRLKNPHAVPVKASVVGSMANVVGFDGYDVFNNVRLKGEGHNEDRDSAALTGIHFTAPDIPVESFDHGSLSLATTAKEGTFRRAEWLHGEWTDNAQDFWEDFRADGMLDPVRPIEATGSALKDFHDFSFLDLKEKIGSVGVRKDLAPHGEAVIDFVIAWHFPNRPRGWIEFDKDIADYKAGKYPAIRNHYATVHQDSWAAADYLGANLARLEGQSRLFEEALYSTDLPSYAVDAVAANIASMRSHCAFRIETGEFLGWEGIRDYVGCGQGNVNHVWNYVQTVAFLFPELEQSMRRVEFNHETDENGMMPFRARTILGQDRWEMIPAADGQMGSILRVWREWKLSGDDAFLSELWEKTRLAMDYAISHWDADGDGLPEGQQSNTYDIEFYGPNPMMSFIYCAALKACVEMAERLGDVRTAERYAALAAASSRGIEDVLWDGDYFVQRIDNVDAHRYQHGIGCHSDQLLGQFMAYVSGMGALVAPDKLKSAIKAVFDNNFLPELRAVHSVQRTYALNDEPGLTLCTWPKGGRPRFAFAYCDEVWTGVEYQVAVNLVHAGLIDEALTVVKALRSRYDGFKRNPWSEIEAGHHYIRAMASFGLITAFSGQKTDLPNDKLSFAPKLKDGRYRSFWICGKGWGTIEVTRAEDGSLDHRIEILYGDLDGIAIEVSDAQ
ncbi:GH116 family glycosyl-hydrolase [Martelella mediterranea]|uniref:Uncharacterized protein (DUF608 family) n=1 Tax=Martelella mediterranea TaxID=293089 RepID=A0A4R3NHX4_9HYPH|nr:GH116 family glycosyl-hydrolase [Martelella mediterranea]TCT33067.1 uncharacterized protein (DUF608 family) [Martelella mediterranea]